MQHFFFFFLKYASIPLNYFKIPTNNMFIIRLQINHFILVHEDELSFTLTIHRT